MTTAPKRRASPPPRPPLRPRIIAAVAAAVLLLAGLAVVLLRGDDPGPDGAQPGAGTTSTATAGTDGDDGAASGGPSGTSTASPTTGPGGTADPSDDALTTPTELEPFLLRGSDLPAGWRTLDSAAEATATLMGTCLEKAITPTVPHSAARTAFRSGSEGPVLSTTVRDFTTPEQSARALTEVRAAVRACVSGTSKPTLRSITLTTKADTAVGVTFVLNQAGASARGEVLVAKVGTRSATLALIGLTEQDLALGRKALDTMIARLD